MGKHKHSKDKLYLNPTEYAESWGGFQERVLPFKKLPLWCCGLSLQKFESPVVTETGEVFEATNIIPYVKRTGKNPITGKDLQVSQLTALKFTRDESGKFIDPITNKLLSENLHVVCNLVSGHVYAYDTVAQMNKKTQSFKDLMTEQKFDWAKHIVTLQDPNQPEKREVRSFHFIKEKEDIPELEDTKQDGSGTGAASSNTAKTEQDDEKQQELARLGLNTKEDKVSNFINVNESLKAVLDASRGRVQEIQEERAAKRAKLDEERKKQEEILKSRSVNKLFTSGAVSKGFTSTAATATMDNEYRKNTDEEERALLYEKVKKRKKNAKGYVKMELSVEFDNSSGKKSDVMSMKYDPQTCGRLSPLGSLNLELHADIAPSACDNFLRHCESGYYLHTRFHRLVPNFVIQGGDPEGTGRGGASAFEDGKPFKDEFDARLKFESRGLLAMANSGKNANKSQFFITLREDIESLQNKHTLFGRVVGNLPLLDSINALPVVGKERPKQNIWISKIDVFSNPFTEYLQNAEKEEEERRLKEEADRDAIWFSNRKDPMKDHEKRESSEIGKYSGLDAILQQAAKPKTLQEMQSTLQSLSKEEREYAAASRKRTKKSVFSFDEW